MRLVKESSSPALKNAEEELDGATAHVK